MNATPTRLPLDVVGIGKALPSRCVTSAMLDDQLGLPAGTVKNTTGMDHRFFLDGDETSDDLQRRAIEEALTVAGIAADDVDCVINASGTMRQAVPFTAANTARLLDTDRRMSCFDINMTCLSSLRALETAAYLLPKYPRILITTCEIPSVAVDWDKLHTAGIFGDGATAMVVTADSLNGGMVHSNFEQLTEGYELCTLTGGGYEHHPSQVPGDYLEHGIFNMAGPELFRLAARELPSFVE